MSDRTNRAVLPVAPALASAVAAEPAEYLDWDSAFFQRRIARVRSGRLSEDLVPAILQWCSERQIDCLYFLADANDPPTVRVAERNGFNFVDIRTTFERSLDDLPDAPAGVRPAGAADIPELKRLTGRSFSDSRFYSDPLFDREACDALYAVWIERSCHGYADCVLVAELDGKAAGYVTCSLGPAQTGSIGLIAVDAAVRGGGIGQKLLLSALHYFRDRGMMRATVVTQGRNLASQRLYQRHHFLIHSVALWYHRWFAPSPE